MPNWWRNLNAYEKPKAFGDFVSFLGRLCQLEVFTKRPNGPIMYASFCISILSSLQFIYTTFFYILAGDVLKAIPSYCMVGIMASTHAAAWNKMFGNRMKWVPLSEMPLRAIYHNDGQSNAYNRICSKSIDQTLKSYIITITVLIFSFFVALIGPAYTYFREGRIVTLYEVRIPFLTDHPEYEFIANIAWQGFISVFGTIGLFIIEGMTSMVNNTITVTKELTINELEDFSHQLETGKIQKEDEKSGNRLKRIFGQIAFTDDYVENFRETWYWRTFLAPPAFLFSISISIFSQYMLGYPAGYGIAVVSYIQKAVLCRTGQKVVDRNEALVTAFYDSKWYLLRVKHQKDVMHMMHHLQNKQGITIGPFEQLNLETLKVLTNKVYSFFMFLMNFGA